MYIARAFHISTLSVYYLS